MFFNRLFRERALARRGRQEPLDDRLQVTAPHEWLLVIGLGAMFVALLVYLAVGSVERSLSYEAVVKRDFPILFATVFVFSLIALVMHLVGDLTYVLVDPRIDFETRE